MKWKLLLISLCLAATACTTTPQTKNDVVAVSQVSNTALVQSISLAATAGKITKADANNLLKQSDVAEEAIKVANGMTGVDATDKLKSAQTIVDGLVKYLATKGVAVK